MKSIVAVGFDMDYTLAQYKAETFETLAYQGTVKKLVYDLGYPKEVLICCLAHPPPGWMSFFFNQASWQSPGALFDTEPDPNGQLCVLGACC